MDEVKVMQVIYCTKKRNGKGQREDDPIRIVTEIFSLDGQLICDHDPQRKFTVKDVIEFCHYENGGKKAKQDILALLEQWKPNN